MKLINTIAAAVMAVVILVACQKENREAAFQKDLEAQTGAEIETGLEDLSSPGVESNNHNRNHRGYVYTLSNQTGGNMVLVYRRAANGSLT